jgi:hypothetical protein
MSEAELEAALFSADVKPPRAPARNLPDFSHIHKELQEHKHVTLQLLWKSTERRIPTDIATVSSATTTSNGNASRK